MGNAATRYPLFWPVGYSRERWPSTSRFGTVSFERARSAIFHELKLLDYAMRPDNIILSTNIPLRQDGFPYASMRQPEDKGVAVYFPYKKEAVVLCCDQWNRVEHNLWAVAKTIEAMRGIERWGVSDFLKHSFQGFNALPPKQQAPAKREWWRVFDYQACPGKASWDLAGVNAQYKSLAKTRHPDTGGSVAAFQELSQAYQEAKTYFGIK